MPWANSPMVVKPKKPAAPLIECTERNTLFTSSMSALAPASSMARNSFSMLARCSWDSVANSATIS